MWCLRARVCVCLRACVYSVCASWPCNVPLLPPQMRQADPNVVTALTHRPWSLSRLGDGTPRYESPWKHHWLQVLDVLLDWAHHHLLWNLCGVSAFLLQKSFISPWVQLGSWPKS